MLEIKTINYQGKRVFEKLVMTADFKRAPKFFTEDEACFLFITEGSFQFRTPTNLLSYSKNEAMLAKCGNYFLEDISINEVDNKLAAIGAFFYPEMVKEFFETDLSIKHFNKNFDVIKVNIEPLMKSFIDSIDFLLDNQAIVDDNIIVNKLKELLIILSKSENSNSINDFVASLFVPYEYNFNEIIQKNLFANLSLPDLAMLCNCSLSTFKRKFVEHYKESPTKYITHKKLEKATQLLQIKSMPIADIAYDCGFETVSHFNKTFKKEFNKTPSEFRLSQ
ncbi:Probable transcriptional regulator, AraC family [Flavobacterium indicum GPTSA100-9 = DSM 17447]|uniref:Probable transcriptional regulator, AraC family n=1 Tax=Flavobacterium indicum (strain DSM 17447 / CIP 109464 / GPTSA100-9) TaxID=1094466 RepID=H8XTN7_FLAIG|nr:AraC family transcriptional regulator [Flavobacterium indicum]CCG53617.1 Probable transcriptional regulator, AraC family [Flavobacterium indicum GPTSA100-9 = DSM 17447]